MSKDTEQIILETARKHFVQKGFSAARMQEIADEAGINKAMLHYYFRSKDKLYQEIISRTLGTIIPRIAGAMKSEGSFLERTEHLVDTYITTILEYPDIPVFIMTELAQKKESFIKEIRKYAGHFPAVQSFMGQMIIEAQAGKIKAFHPVHLLMNIIGMTVFPFMAKPVINTVLGVSDKQFIELMEERKSVIMEFVEGALLVK